MDTIHTIVQNDDYLLYLTVFVAGVILLLLTLVLSYKRELHKQQSSVTEYKDKVKYLRQITAENEHRHSTFIHETEKTIMRLEHTIEALELKVKEGTKNQVVSMLETQKNKRAKQLERAGLYGKV
jgi:predicted RNase H-like nuclease (RuvC/YqgF family)